MNGFNTKGKVIIVPSKFAKENTRYNSCLEYNLNLNKSFSKYITVTPHIRENWQNLELENNKLIKIIKNDVKDIENFIMNS